MPVDPGGCIYGLPALNGPERFLAVYKGTVGNAVLETYDFYDQSAIPQNTVNTSPDNFNGTQGDDFFSIALGYTTQDELTSADTYFRTGAGNVPTSFYILPWKWGVKPTSPLTVTADNSSIVQGSALPALTATLSGFIAPDTATSNDVTGTAACTTTATASSTAATYPITCTVGTLASAGNYTFSTFVPGTLTITPPPPPADTKAPVITITSPIDGGLYAKTDTSVHVTATVTDQSALANTTYWFNGVIINPANALPLSNAPIVSKIAVSASDIYGNTATSTVTIYIVRSVNSCLLDIFSVLTAIAKDKTLPSKPTILNLIADCSALFKGFHRWDLH